jgi:hypothetical protein
MPRKPPPRKPPGRRHEDDRPEDMPPPGTLRRRLADPAFRREIQEAGVIFGADRRTGKESLFFGKATLERIIRTGQAKQMAALSVTLDYDTDDVECLAGACLALKGSHCYQTGEADPIMAGLN